LAHIRPSPHTPKPPGGTPPASGPPRKPLRVANSSSSPTEAFRRSKGGLNASPADSFHQSNPSRRTFLHVFPRRFRSGFGPPSTPSSSTFSEEVVRSVKASRTLLSVVMLSLTKPRSLLCRRSGEIAFITTG